MDNDIAYNLLKSNPIKLICSPIFQASIKKVVNKWVHMNRVKPDQVDDLIQEINTLLLERKLSQIQKNYKPDFGNLQLYFERTVYNLCVDLVAKPAITRQQYYSIDKVNANLIAMNRQSEKELLEIEKRKLLALIDKLQEQKYKFLLLLKLYSRLPLSMDDIKHINPRIDKALVRNVLQSFGKDYVQLEDREIFEKVTPFFNLIEQKKVSPDATRKWFSDRVNVIIIRMNKRRQNLKYDRESIKNLTQMMFNETLICY